MMLRRLLLALLAFGACTAMAHAGLYVGASVGNAKVNDGDVLGSDFSASDTASKVYGGFTIMKFLAVEVSYNKLGSPKDTVSGGTTDAEIKITGYDAYAVGVLPLGKRFEIFGKAGLIFWDGKSEFSGAFNGSESDSGNDPAYGAGIVWHLFKRLDVRAEYERFNIKNIDKVEFGSIGANFRF
jgi:outer membrane protein with beta-barrel domain